MASIFEIGYRVGIIQSTGKGSYTPPVDPPPGEVDYVIFTDGTTTIRKQVRNGYLAVDKALTALGFGEGGLENTDWINIKTSQ